MASYDELAVRLKAMGHPIRLQILDLLRTGEVCVCHLETALDKRQAYISQQLMVLREAGLVDTRKVGLQVFYQLTDDTTVRLLDSIFGISEDSRPIVIEGCPCPNCSETCLITQND